MANNFVSRAEQRALLICDSRGEGLNVHLNYEKTNIEWRILMLKGRGLQQLVRAAFNESLHHSYNVIVVAGGICDITRRERRERRISVRDGSPQEIVENILREITGELEEIRVNGNNVILASTYGLDLWRYNFKLFGSYFNVNLESDQTKIVETVDELNKALAYYNKNGGNNTIRLGNKIHHVKSNGRIKSYYEYLRDGCHPSEVMLLENATEILKMVKLCLWNHR